MIKISERNQLLDSGKDLGLGIATGLTDEAAMAAAKKSGLVAVQNVAKNAKPTANIAATVVGIAANPLIAFLGVKLSLLITMIGLSST